MAPAIPSDSEGSEGSDGGDNEDGAAGGATGGDVFKDGLRLSREEDGGQDENMASAFKGLKIVDPRRKKIN